MVSSLIIIFYLNIFLCLIIYSFLFFKSYVLNEIRPIICGDMLISRARMGVAALDGCLYIIGGYNHLESLNTVEQYDPSKNKWFTITSMNHRRADPGVGILNGKIYVIGGTIRSNRTINSVEVYCPKTSQWTLVI